jgi:hypothetical protein
MPNIIQEKQIFTNFFADYYSMSSSGALNANKPLTSNARCLTGFFEDRPRWDQMLICE